jgi:Family of unknown function (DUF5953)
MPLLSNQIRFVIPVDPKTWPARIEAACAVLETVFSDERLNIGTPYQSGKERIVLTDRPKYLRAKLKTQTRWFNITNGKSHVGYGAKMRDEGMLTLGGGANEASTLFPICSLNVCETLLAKLGDALQAHYAQWSPIDTFLWLRWAQWGHTIHGIELPPHNLPQLQYLRNDAPEQPEILGWLNYWSPSACAYIGFPDATLDQDLTAHSYLTPAGAWLVKLGPTPLDYRVAEHRATLAAIYRRFPRIGVRC